MLPQPGSSPAGTRRGKRAGVVTTFNGGAQVSVHEGGSERATALRGGAEGEARGGFDFPGAAA